MNTSVINRHWVLRERPAGEIRASNFELRQGRVPEPAPGEVLVRVLMISIDLANRAWMFPTASMRWECSGSGG